LLTLPLPDGATRRGLLVAPQVAGRELILGARRDPSFGPLVVVGLGGILAEAIDDVTIRLAPVSAAEAEAMLDALRGRRVLGPLRGQPGINRAAVIDAIVRLGQAMVEDPNLIEVDLNPVISSPDRTVAVDALVVVIV
jgi:acetyltransferase